MPVVAPTDSAKSDGLVLRTIILASGYRFFNHSPVRRFSSSAPVALANEDKPVTPHHVSGLGKHVQQSWPEVVDHGYEAPSDRTLASAVTQAVAKLQETIDTAIRAGLIVVPSFKAISGRFNEVGVSVDSHICTVEIHRKLA